MSEIWVCACPFLFLIGFGVIMHNQEQQQQTALLQQIAAQTKQPVRVEVSGFSPEAQQVFNAAMKPKGRK